MKMALSRPAHGAVRFEVEWQVIRERCVGAAEIDSDTDLETRVKYYATHSAAFREARRIFKIWHPTGRLYWGVVGLSEQQAEWLVQEDGITTWETVAYEEVS